MPLLFLKEKNKKGIRENVQISTSSILNKTNITLKQKMLYVVTITMICSTYNNLHKMLEKLRKLRKSCNHKRNTNRIYRLPTLRLWILGYSGERK